MNELDRALANAALLRRLRVVPWVFVLAGVALTVARIQGGNWRLGPIGMLAPVLFFLGAVTAKWVHVRHRRADAQVQRAREEVMS
ncbi:MAG: hypothetical protein KDB73_15760 [Planctomycetes bacterium]|nr:hypothetical protein [Planctomycetota bacterium]